jgi:hypothetical protein
VLLPPDSGGRRTSISRLVKVLATFGVVIGARAR